jgi:hypothetical protein
MVSRMAGCLSAQAASLVLVVAFTTLATSDRRRVASLPALITSGAYCAACQICPFSPIVSACPWPSKPPSGSSTLAPRTAV